MYDGICLPENTVISDIALTADNPLHCVLADSSEIYGDLLWRSPDSDNVCQCDNGQCQFTSPEETPLICSQSSTDDSLQLFKNMNTVSSMSFSGKHRYTCNFNTEGQGISFTVLIESELLVFRPHRALSMCLYY